MASATQIFTAPGYRALGDLHACLVCEHLDVKGPAWSTGTETRAPCSV